MLLFNRYEYDPQKDLLGKGGFAKVYKAIDNKFDRYVALKIYKVGEVAERYNLSSEIRRVISLDHPNICRYLDMHELETENTLGDKDVLQICIMELMDAGSISQYYERHKSFDVLNKLLIDILNGISYLHKKGIIHRDIKPANILIKKTDEGPVAKITDFGISKKMDSENSNSSSAILGSISYMAPEQFLPKKYGINSKVSSNIDLWAFGVMVYELLTGDTLFGKPGSQTTAEEVMSNITTPDLPENINNLPEPYKELLSKCLVKNANERIQKADELIELLQSKTVNEDTKVYQKNNFNATQTTEETKVYKNENEPKPVDEYPQMVYVEGGTFSMGDDLNNYAKPIHKVTLSNFKISKTLVTVKQFREFCLQSGRSMSDYDAPTWGWHDNHPMVNVSWDEAVAYCDWLSEKMNADYRLPTEAEWEYAARGGKLSKNTEYSGSNNADLVAWHKDNSGSKTHAVATKKANELGLYDMSGNVWEWCHDWYDEGYYASSPSSNPKGPSTGSIRVSRGGSWEHSYSCCRIVYRSYYPPDCGFEMIGFRVVLLNEKENTSTDVDSKVAEKINNRKKKNYNKLKVIGSIIILSYLAFSIRSYFITVQSDTAIIPKFKDSLSIDTTAFFATEELKDSNVLMTKPEITSDQNQNYKNGIQEFDRGNFSSAIKLFAEAASKGNSSAAGALAYCHWIGLGTIINKQKAHEYADIGLRTEEPISAAVKAGLLFTQKDAKAQTYFKLALENKEKLEMTSIGMARLGSFYLFGRGVEKNIPLGINLLEKVAKSGEPSALNNLGTLYFDGKDVEKNIALANKYFLKAANKGNPVAMYNLGKSYRYYDKNYNEAYKWFKKAAEKNEDASFYDLGKAYLYGEGTEKNYKSAIEWLTKSVKLRENGDNCFSLGHAYYLDDQDEKAFQWFTKASEQGNLEAYSFLGHMYDYGNHVQQNWNKAFQYYTKGESTGQYLRQIGEFYLFGVGGAAQDIEKAKSYFLKSADKRSNMYLKVLSELGSKTSYSGKNDYGDKIDVTATNKNPFVMDKLGNTWNEKVNISFGASSSVQVFPIPPSSMSNENAMRANYYSRCPTIYTNSEHEIWIGQSKKAIRNIGYMYVTAHFNKAKIVVPIPMALAWPPAQ
jgi:TPR repeat protein/formylglycine-generating enzyme required for sulfatase activity